MSAIWGVITKEKRVPEEIVTKMKQSMEGFRIDDYRDVIRDGICFACGMQFFTQQARGERLPIYDADREIFFTADCVLTNREELIGLLRQKYNRNELEACGDGELSYQAYLLWGERFVEKLRGSFSFAIYDLRRNKLFLYADHFARRYLAYSFDEQKVCFSTLYQPILSIMDQDEKKLNEAWIAASFSDCTADTIKLAGVTVYDRIFHVEPGQYVQIDLNTNHITKMVYWNPVNRIRRLKLENDEEYRRLFLSTLQKNTEALLCTTGETGIMLSGGLDSSSIAAFAALQLQQRGKKLYSYTSVPAGDYVSRNTALKIENEKEYICAQQKLHTNLYPQFIGADDVNCFTKMEEHVLCYSEPVKPILNLVNSHEMMSKAAADGCKLMLSGQNGNATISYGGILTYVYQNALRFHWIKAYREARSFCNRFHLTRKRFVHILFKTYSEEKLKRYKVGSDCLLKDTLIRKYRVNQLERSIMRSRGTGYMDSRRQRKGFGFMPLVYQHMGFYDTYDSLRYGILAVDPTLSKEVVELCLQLPLECFVRNGKERRAVRDYMKGYVPDMILDNFAGRGVQAADFAYRVNRDWKQVRDDVKRLLSNPRLLDYLEEAKLQRLRSEIDENEYHLDQETVAKAAVISSLSTFLNYATQDSAECDS